MFNKKFDIVKGFQTSVNIAFDMRNDDKVRNFIPTISSLDIIEDVMLSTAPMATQRARIVIGAYGRGKSHIILVLMSLLFKKNRDIFETILSKVQNSNPQLCDFVINYIESERKILPIVVSGSSASLTQSFLSALQQGLNDEGLEDLMPETHFKASINAIEGWRLEYPDTYKRFVESLSEPIDSFMIALKEYDVLAYEKFTALYPTLTSGSTFNPFLGFDVVELYGKVVDKLKDRGFDGIFIVYDEFSKYLESSIANASISDIKLLQDFAEKCDRSGNKQMHLMLICHKDIANYIDNKLPKEKVDGWRGVSGRFKHISIHNNFSQMYEIISTVIKKDPIFWDGFCVEHEGRFDDLRKRFTANGLLDAKDESSVSTVVYGCYPLHPISTFILPRLSEKVAQNERTLFTFLSADDKYTLSAFLSAAEGDFPMLTPDYLYDYFESLLRKEPYTSETHKYYKLTSTILRRVDPNSLGAKIIKTIALIYIVEQFEKLPPIYNVIVDAFQDSFGSTKIIGDALSELIEKDCIVYLKRSNNYLKLKETSGFDIHGEIEKTIEKCKESLSVSEILNKSVFNNYMYPTRYNDDHEITRYFDFTFIGSNDFWNVDNWEMKISTSNADGVVYAIIPKDEADIKNIQIALQESDRYHDRIVFVLPKKNSDIEKIVFEYRAVLLLKSLAAEDEVINDEYDIYIEDLEEVIGNYIFSFTRPENGSAEYYYKGQRKNFFRKAQMSALLTDICENIFPHTPLINNESINKNSLSTVAVNSRAKILAGLLGSELDANLGLIGTGQDVSIMRSTLIRTGILEHADTNPVLNMDPEDANIHNMLCVIQDFFTCANANGGKSFAVLYDALTLPQYGIGLKTGVIPIYIAAVLHLHKKNLVIKYNDAETKISPDLLNCINENPSRYSVIIEDWNEEKAEYLKGLEEIFIQYVNEKEKAYNSFTYLVLAMNRWYMSLPKYAKEMTNTYIGDYQNEKFRPLSKTKKRFISSLKQIDVNPREYLFEKLFIIFGQQEFGLDILHIIRATKDEFDNAVTNLINMLICDVRSIFCESPKGSLTSAIRDWYEDLETTTTEYLFTNNENRVLSLMQSVTHDENVFMQRLCKTVTSLRIEDWSTNTIFSFLRDLEAFKITVESYNKNIDRAASGTEMYRILFKDNNGNEVTKSFSKTEYSNRAKLLLNDISTSLEEMGQSISKQEKRQVLMELLEKLF